MQERVVYINSDLYLGGQFIPESEARLYIWDLGYTYGYNVYDVARTIKGKPWQLKEHLARFYRSCKACRLDPKMSSKELERVCEEVCSRNEHLIRKDKGEDFCIWIEATPGEYWFEHGRSGSPTEGKGRPTVIVKNSQIDIGWQLLRYREGLHLVSPPTTQAPPNVRDPKIKTYSRINQSFAVYESKLEGPECWPLMLDIYGNLTETQGANFFLIYGGVIMTPTTRNILEGVSRSNVIHLAKQLKIPVIERDLQPFHLYNAKEAFISTTPYCIVPISLFNGVSIGSEEIPGPVTRRLIDAWSEWVNHDITCLSYLDAEERSKLEERARQGERASASRYMPHLY